MSKLSDMVVIDIGSKSICAYNAEYLSDDNFAVKNAYEIEYSGFMDGNWIAPEEVIPSMVKLIDKIERSSERIKHVYVGIPSQFAVIRTVYEKLTFPQTKRVTKTDIDDLFEESNPFIGSPFTKIHAEAVYFINDKGDRVASPIGKDTSVLKTQISYVGVKTEVITAIRQGLLRYGVKSVEFIQSEYASALALFSKQERDNGVILADIGYLSTSVVYVGGDALLELKDFSLGGSMIALGISTTMNIPFNVASALAAKINLGYKGEGDYSLKYDAKTYTYPIEQINDISKECISCVVNYIQKAMRSFRFETSNDQPIYLTGGGFSDIKFAREYISKCFDREVEMVQPSMPNYDKPCYSTTVGLLKKAIIMEKQEKFGFLKRLFRL